MDDKRLMPLNPDHSKIVKLTKITNQLRSYCITNNVPFFFAIPIANEHGTTKYLQDGRSGSACGVKVMTDYIPQCIMVMNGCYVIPPIECLELDFNSESKDVTLST